MNIAQTEFDSFPQPSGTPKVSVAMITYNHERYIDQAIESVLMQQANLEYELVIGEDCSQDNTLEIVESYQARYPDKIRLLTTEKNLGPKKNLARTYQACQGEYVALLEGDDYWNYGGSVGVVVYYGANDGQLRAVNGNKTAPGASGVEAGGEYWSFIAEEFFPKLKRLRDNRPGVELSTTQAGLDTAPRDYFFDGPISVYQKVESGVSSRVILYVGLRRGGRTLYAFDVTQPTEPKFLWKVNSATTGMSQLGQTWAEARLAKIRGFENAEKPVVILAGGYDAAAEDSGAVTSMGNVVFVWEEGPEHC